jgi:hypothetical protein
MGMKFDRVWWEPTWAEREDALWQAFGPSQPHGAPPGYVTSFDFKRVPFPGACAYTFPPNDGDPDAGRERRSTWLYTTHGLAQWLNPEDMRSARDRGATTSGTGVEFGLVFDAETPWAPGLLEWIMRYVHEKQMFSAGDRVPFWFESIDEGAVKYWVGDGPGGDDPTPADSTRALAFWRYLSPFGSFTTSTGNFEIRIATSITAREWELAKQTSSCHLLLMLNWAGVGQRSIPGRQCVTQCAGWEEAWRTIGTLPFEATKDRLRALWRATSHGLPM